jgi:hypothetical protein
MLGGDQMLSRLTSSEVEKLYELLVKRALGDAAGEDYVEWAWSMQGDGLDTPYLRILAGQDWPFDLWEVERYFLQTLEDLKVELPSEDVLSRQCVCLIARGIVSGAIPPAEGCRNIARLWFYLDHPSALRNWDTLEDDLPVRGERSSDRLNSTIIEAAKALLASSFCAGGIMMTR